MYKHIYTHEPMGIYLLALRIYIGQFTGIYPLSNKYILINDEVCKRVKAANEIRAKKKGGILFSQPVFHINVKHHGGNQCRNHINRLNVFCFNSLNNFMNR